MANEPKLNTTQPDPAAVFACALSLREACLKSAAANPYLNLSESYNGMDEFMRELMRVANLFEAWACAHVAFEGLSEVWPYLMEDKFGNACLVSILPSALAQFDADDCLRVALRLRLPIRADDKRRVPVDVRALNPIAVSSFREFRIQTVRDNLEDGDVVPFTTDDDPFDEEFGRPYFALYGVGEDGLLEHIANRETYADVLSLTCSEARAGRGITVHTSFLRRPRDSRLLQEHTVKAFVRKLVCKDNNGARLPQKNSFPPHFDFKPTVFTAITR